MKPIFFILFLSFVMLMGCSKSPANNINTYVPNASFEDDEPIDQYLSLEENLDILVRDNNKIGLDHYKELKSEMLRLESQGLDVENLREKLSSIPIAEIGRPRIEINCTEVKFTEYFVDPVYVEKVGQIGVIHGSGQFTVGRSYVSLKNDLDLDKIPIYAPTKMVLFRGSHYQDSASVGVEGYLSDYTLDFDAGCGVTIIFAHLKEVVDSIGTQLQEVKLDSRTDDRLEPIEFKAGDLIGYFIQNAGVAGFDFMVHDSNVINQFANQARQEFEHGTNLLHAVCPYDFYDGQKKEDYYNLIGGAGGTLFKVKECGPISRDFPGTISGQWFLDKNVIANIYDYYMEGSYGSLIPIVGDEEGVTIGRVNGRASTRIYANFPTYRLPKDVTDEHCYQIHPNHNPSEWDGYVFFKLVNDEEMNVFYGETGNCPNNFPDAGFVTYYR